ncbi:hypothetical protein EV693_1111, partial [Nicoletella semolina]
MQKSVFSLKKSVVALAVLGVSGVGVADINEVKIPDDSISKLSRNSSKNYSEAMKRQLEDNVKTEFSLRILNGFAGLAHDGVYANGIYKGISTTKPMVLTQSNYMYSAFVSKYEDIFSKIQRGEVIAKEVKGSGIFSIEELSNREKKILEERKNSLLSLNTMAILAKVTDVKPKDGALIASLANQSIINQKLQELTVGSHKQLKLDIDRLDDVVKGHREEINWLKSDLEDAVIGIEGNSNQIAAVSYDLADLQSEVEYTTSTMREDIAEAHEAIVLLDRADE